MQKIIVNTNDVDQRIDNFLKKSFPQLSMPLIYKYLRTKRIKVNDKKVDFDYRLMLNDVISLYINDELLSKKNRSSNFKLASNEINVVYEDDYILIVNKPIGLSAHDDDTNNNDTLINRVLHYLSDRNEWNNTKENYFTPALVHRIDRNTSGLVMIAKNAKALKILNQKMKDREIEKYYLARVHGIIDPKQNILHDYLTRNEDSKIVKVTKKPINHNSVEIITEYKTISHEQDTSLLEVKLITGKTHQIRAHLAFIGHPLVGEKKYTDERFSHLNKKDYQSLKAYKIIFNFKTDADVLNYLKNKVVEIK